MELTSARLSKAAIWLNAFGGLLGTLGLLGHVLHVEWFISLFSDRPHMRLGSALSIVLAALGIALQHRQPVGRVRRSCSRAIGAALVVFGIMVHVEYAFDVNLHIDVRFPSLPAPGPYPGRVSPFAALAIAQLGAMLLVQSTRRFASMAREALCLSATLAAFVALTGHAFGTTVLFEVRGSHIVGASLPTSLALCTLGVAAWLERPQAHVLRLTAAPGPGGVVLRRLGLTAVLGGPALMGMLLIFMSMIDGVDMRFILALGGVLGAVLALSLLVTTAARLERTAEAAEASRVRATGLFEEAPEGIFVADTAGHYTDMNAAGCRLLNYSREEILTKSVADLLPECDLAQLERERERMRQGAVSVAEWRVRRKDGTYALVEATAKILPDGRWQSFVRDISERRKLERELVESRDFLQSVLESSTEYAIVAEDLERRVVLWNEGARRTLGYELDEIYGKPSDLLVAPARRTDWAALHAQGVHDGVAEGNILARRKDGNTFAARIVCTRRLGPDHCAAGVLTVTRDLTTEQRYLAEQEFLSRVGVELASCLEYRETLVSVTQLATSFLGDFATIDVVKDSSLRREWTQARGPGQEKLARSCVEFGAPQAATHPVQTVRETKQPLLLAQVSDEDRKRAASSAAHLRLLEASNVTSAMFVPLIARGQLLAVLSIAARDGSRTYGPTDLRLAMELARRAALTLDNVQLFQQSRLQGAMTTNLAEGAVLLRAADRAIVYANPRFARMFGLPLHELLGVRIATLSSSLEAAHTRMAEQLEHSAHWHDELECARNDGTRFWCSISVSNFDHQEHGRVWIALFTDITERKSLEERTARAMQEKDVLLKEIHHRVKNNLQVISSLFSLQRERTHSLELKRLLSESQTRVESIALVHEQLYRSADLAAIDFDEYLRSLLSAVRSSYGADQIQTEISAKNVLLDVERAVPCALLVCELVSNSIKHAFGDAPGKIWVRVRHDRQGDIVLEVGDDGRGMPPDFDWRKTRALGLRLVQSLARQLRATIVVERSPGTRFILTFANRTSKAAAPHANFMTASAGR